MVDGAVAASQQPRFAGRDCYCCAKGRALSAPRRLDRHFRWRGNNVSAPPVRNRDEVTVPVGRQVAAQWITLQ